MGNDAPQPDRPRKPRVAAAGLVCLLVAVVVGVAWKATRREGSTPIHSDQSDPEPEPATQDQITQWTESARTHERNQNLLKAAAVYEEALRSRLPEQTATAFRHRRIEALILLGDAVAAREELQRLSDRSLTSSDQVRVLVHEARLSRLEGHPERAIAYLDKALPDLGFLPAALCERGILNLDLGRLPEAVRDLSQVVKAVPDHEIAHYKLAEAYRRLKRPADAERHLRAYERIHLAALKRSLPTGPEPAR